MPATSPTRTAPAIALAMASRGRAVSCSGAPRLPRASSAAPETVGPAEGTVRRMATSGTMSRGAVEIGALCMTSYAWRTAYRIDLASG